MWLASPGECGAGEYWEMARKQGDQDTGLTGSACGQMTGKTEPDAPHHIQVGAGEPAGPWLT